MFQNNTHTRKIKATHFTLLELFLALSILGVFLFICSDTLVSTLITKETLEEQYAKNRVKNIGWHILYQDLTNAVGIYYHEGTTWQGIPKAKKKGKKKKDSLKTSKDELFSYISSPDGEEPFLEFVVSRGRSRKDPKNQRALGFKNIKYYIQRHPDENVEGELLLRTEEVWDTKEEEDAFSSDSEPDLQEDYRRYAVIEGLSDVSHAVYSGTAWVEEWESSKKGDLPLALKINYTRIGQNEEEHKIIPIPISYQIIGEPEEEI